MAVGKWLLASLGLLALMIGIGLIGSFILGAGSVLGLLVGACLSVVSVYALHGLQPPKARQPQRGFELWVRPRLSPHERDRFAAFGRMSLNDVRARAEEFEAAQAQYEEWLESRRERRAHALDPDEQEGYASEVQDGVDRARQWRALERELRSRSLWEVGELPERERLRWAKRMVALSEVLSRPQRRWLGPKPARPEVRQLTDDRNA